jgi:ABC-type sugar transport system, ATPase component
MRKELLRMEHITTYHNDDKVLDNAKFNLFYGEIVGIVGLNNAGKSTLMGGITGLFPCSFGRIFFEEELIYINSIKEARAKGIYYIQQNTSLIKDLTVIENIFLTKEKDNSIFINKKRFDENTRYILRLFGLDNLKNTLVIELDQFTMLYVEICKAIVNKAKILIFDEIINELNNNELNKISQLFEKLILEDISIVLIEQYIKDILPLCRRLFIMREGRTVGIINHEEFAINRIISLMIGNVISEIEEHYYQNQNFSETEIASSFEIIRYDQKIHKLSFNVKKNETLGILDLDNSYKDRVLDALAGENNILYTKLLINGKVFTNTKDSKISVLLDKNNFIPEWTIENNIILPALEAQSNFLGIMNKRELKYIFNELIEEFFLKENEIYIQNKLIPINILIEKKIAICRGLSVQPNLMVFVNPRKHLDIISQEVIFRDIASIKKKNIAILIFSSDIYELQKLCDRIIIIKNFNVIDIIDVNNITQGLIFKKYGKYLKDL